MMIERDTHAAPLPTGERVAAKRPGAGGMPKRGSSATIRRARLSGLAACADIINDYIDATEWLPRVKGRDEIAGFFSPALLATRTVLVAEVDGRVAAYMSVSDVGWVYALYSDDGYRGQGLGRLLIDRAKALHPAGLELTVFEPNHAARRFYEREGFVEIPERRDEDTDEGVPILLMRWEGGR